MTAPEAPAERGQRVSAARLAQLIEYHDSPHNAGSATIGALALDLRDARARIAELERELRLLRDAVARVAMWDWTEKACDEAAFAYSAMISVAKCVEREDELIGFEEELAAANARADRLAAENAGLRARLAALAGDQS